MAASHVRRSPQRGIAEQLSTFEGILVTVMLDRYFGIPQHVIRSGLWARMKPSEWSLYVCLMHESERYSTREIQRTDVALCALAGVSSRAFCNARKKLQEYGLLICHRGRGNAYVYTVCDPQTGTPWPGDPKQKIPYRRRDGTTTAPLSIASRTSVALVPNIPSRGEIVGERAESSLQSHGMPLKF